MTLVSIVGDFYSSVLPIFYEFSQKIDTHIVVCDDFKTDTINGKKIYNGTTNFIKNNNLNIKNHFVVIDEDSLESIDKLIKEIYHFSDDKDIYINVTDGLTNIALVLAQKLLSKGVKFISYDRFDNTYNLLTNISMEKIPINRSLNIKNHFLLKDTKIISQSDVNFAKEYEKELKLLFEKYSGNKKIYFDYESYDAVLDSIQTGFLYEFYIYNLLKKLNYDDIALGTRVKDVYFKNAEFENEFDILVIKDNHLHMIECKFRDNLNKTELIYKVDSVRNILDEDSKIIIITNELEYKNKNIIDIFPSLKRANAKKIYFRGSPSGNVESFLADVDIIFELKTKNLKDIFKTLTTFKSKISYEVIFDYLNGKMQTNINFYDKKEIMVLFNYQTAYKYKDNEKVKEVMENKNLKTLIKKINKVKNFHNKDELSEIFKFFLEVSD